MAYIYLLYILSNGERGERILACEKKTKIFFEKVLTNFESHAIMTKLSSKSVAAWFSRLERRPVTPEVEGSSPFAVAIHAPKFRGMNFAAIAQQVERILGKDEVPSSNLGSSSKSLENTVFSRLFSFSLEVSRAHP